MYRTTETLTNPITGERDLIRMRNTRTGITAIIAIVEHNHMRSEYGVSAYSGNGNPIGETDWYNSYREANERALDITR